MRRVAKAAVVLAGVVTAALSLGACGSSATPTSANAQDASAPVSTAVGSASSAPEVNPAGDIPDNQVYVPWSPTDHTFTVSVPEGWARTDVNGSTAFTDKLNAIAIQSGPQPTAPTAVGEQAAVDAVVGAMPGYAKGSTSTVNRSAGDAILVTYAVDSAPDAVTGKVLHDAVERYTFWKNGTAVTLTLSGPVGADNVDPWRTVTDSFSWSS